MKPDADVVVMVTTPDAQLAAVMVFTLLPTTASTRSAESVATGAAFALSMGLFGAESTPPRVRTEPSAERFS